MAGAGNGAKIWNEDSQWTYQLFYERYWIFCGAASARSMIVNHEGKLTGCLEVVDSLDLDANIFNFGYYVPEEKRFEIDFSKVKIMQERHADALSGCNLCYARYTCAGGCAVKAVRESNNFFARDLLYCAFTKI